MRALSGRHVRRAGGFLLCAALVATAVVTGTSRAGSNFSPKAVVTVTPHVVTAGQEGFVTIKFINPGPSTVNHVFATLTTTLPLTAFFGVQEAGCTLQTSSITCDIGQVSPGTARRALRFVAPSASTAASFHTNVSITFDESKNNQLTDTVGGDDDFTVAPSSDNSRRGVCTSTNGDPSSIVGENDKQRTLLTYPAVNLGWNPCTPASTGVDARTGGITNVARPFGEISFAEFLDGNGLATVKVYFFTTPSGITKKNIALFEVANYPNDLIATKSGNGNPAIPKCVLVDGVLQIPSGSAFRSCLAGADNLPGGGVVAELRARGGTDPGWGGIG